VPKKDRAEVLEILRGIISSHSLEAAREGLRRAVDCLEKRYPKVAAFLEETGEEMLAVHHLPVAHRKQMSSTNMLERFNQELKRRTRVVRIFPNEAACVRLASALAIEMNEEWLERRYLTMPEEEAVRTSETVQVAC
jgi:putative transposase